MSKKLLSVGIVMVLVAAVFVGVGATTASAQSLSLCQTVDALIAAGVIAPDKVAVAKAAAGCGVTTSASYTFTKSLTMGSTGADVTALQNFLISSGYTIPAGPTGYFGAQTQAAVIAYQTAKGIAPAVGYFGPITIASVNANTQVVVTPPAGGSTVPGCATGALFSATTGASCTGGTTSTPTPGLTGTFGTISTISQLSQYSAEEVGAGQKDVKVAGFEVKSSNDGDIQLSAIKLTFDNSGRGAGDSSRLVDYVDSVSVWQGSTRVASADASDFTRDSTAVYSRTLALDNAIVRADATQKFYITVDAVSNLDSGDINSDAWTVAINNIRYVDGSGVTTTETAALATSGAGTLDTGVSMDFVTFSSAADIKLKIAKATDSPDAGVVEVETSSVTDDVVLLKGTMRLTGDSDVWLDELPITLTTTGSGNVDDVTGTVKLTIDGKEYSESIASTATTTITVTFDNLDLDIDSGSTINFTISADIEDTGGALTNGDTLVASITTTNRAAIIAENEEGDLLTDSTEMTGSATGEVQAFYDEGVKVTLVGTPTISKTAATVTNNSDIAVATIKIKVEAFGDTMYLATVATAADGLPHVLASADADVTIDVVDLDTTADEVGDGYEIVDGTSETFTFTITMSTAEATSQLARVSITSLAWDSVSTGGADGETYTFNLDNFKSPSTTIKQI